MMATQFCMSCGRELPAEAQFCLGCGKPTGGAGVSAPAPPPLAFPPSAGVPGGTSGGAPPDPGAVPLPPLGSILGLEGCRNFLLQHQLLTEGRNYRVLNHEKRHLFTVKENVGQDLWANMFRSRPPPRSGAFFGQLGAPTYTYTWGVEDASRNVQGVIQIQMHGNTAVSTLVNAAGAPILAVSVERSLMGTMNATAAFPDGRAMFQTKGNLIRHSFSVHDPSGGEVAKIHESFASLRDTYNLDIVGNVDPLAPLIFAILIDREKGK
jgi:hypothetical protein